MEVIIIVTSSSKQQLWNITSLSQYSALSFTDSNRMQTKQLTEANMDSLYNILVLFVEFIV